MRSLLATLVLGSLAGPPVGPPVELARPTTGSPRVPAAGAAEEAVPALAWRVRVLSGRATLAREGEVVELGAGRAETGGEGPATLALGSASRLEVVWPSLASLRIEGPAELEWGIAERSGELRLDVGAAARLDLEARRRPLAIELTQGWSLEVAEAAVQLAGEPSGGWLVGHHGGREVRVRSRVPREDADWPRQVRPGDRVRLGPARGAGTR